MILMWLILMWLASAFVTLGLTYVKWKRRNDGE